MKYNAELSLARGFTVLFIPAIHSLMVFSRPGIEQTLIGTALSFIAEGPGAQLFMTIMGMLFVFGSPANGAKTARRAMRLLGAGYALNALKFVYPYQWGWLPPQLLQDLQVPAGDGGASLFLIGDILHFAAISLLILYVVCSSRNRVMAATILAGAIVIASPLLADMHDADPFLNYILQLAGGKPPQVFFPLFPWLVFPLLGVVIGQALQTDKAERVYKQLFWHGLIWIALGKMLQHYWPDDSATGFYRTNPGGTLVHAGIVAIWLPAWQKLAQLMPPNSFFRLLDVCNRHITAWYIIQWVLICWLIPLAGYRSCAYTTSLVIAAAITVTTFCITVLLNRIQQRLK